MAYLPHLHYCCCCNEYLGDDNGDGICPECDRDEDEPCPKCGEGTAMKINDLVEKAHRMAMDKGWYEEPRTFGELIALVHSEFLILADIMASIWRKRSDRKWRTTRNVSFGTAGRSYEHLTHNVKQ